MSLFYDPLVAMLFYILYGFGAIMSFLYHRGERLPERIGLSLFWFPVMGFLICVYLWVLLVDRDTRNYWLKLVLPKFILNWLGIR